MLTLGIDVGSSSVKVSLLDTDSGRTAASAASPGTEAPIIALRPGWAEQDPDSWWSHLSECLAEIKAKGHDLKDIGAIGISYQMHGLVCVGGDRKPLRPSIIWCDSRAVPYGDTAYRTLGPRKCMERLLNSPGNFTAAKLAWVKDNEPEIFDRTWKAMLPGDYIAMRLTGEAATTVSGLSEGMLWDFVDSTPAGFVMDGFGFSGDILPGIVPTFGEQGRVTEESAALLGLKAGTPVCYRAGDQPNNALSLGVLNPGEVAATAGTSGVVYGVGDRPCTDPQSRVNVFAHVNHSPENPRLGVLLCINGTGILNSWMHRNIVPDGMSYAQMNELAAQAPAGSAGLSILPFGNGAERMLCNRDGACSIHGLNFNMHGRSHLLRAAQEGIVFAFCRGMEIMKDMGLAIRNIHAGSANMFLSPLFRQTLATASGATIQLMDTDGAAGAARGAALGAGIYVDASEAFATLETIMTVEPSVAERDAVTEAYERWKSLIDNQ